MGLAGTDVAREAADVNPRRRRLCDDRGRGPGGPRMHLRDPTRAAVPALVQHGRGAHDALGVLLAGALGVFGGGRSRCRCWRPASRINLLTDSAPALAMAFDLPPDDVMRRRPRGATERPSTGEDGPAWPCIGLVMAVVTLFVAFEAHRRGGLLGGTGDIELARTMAFTTLVLAQLFNCFNARSGRTSALHRPFSNRVLWGAIGLSLLRVLVVEAPFLNDAFGTVPMSAGDACVPRWRAWSCWQARAWKLALRWHARRARPNGA
ncbi:MAG: cation-translocating P-type ATPase [Chloroflexota bacterium]